MPSFTCCFGNWRGSTGNNAAVQNVEQPSTSDPEVQNAEQPTTSDSGVQNEEQPSTSNSGEQNAEQPATSESGVQNAEQPSTSNPSDATRVLPANVIVGGSFSFDEVSQILFRLANVSRDEEVCFGTLNNQTVAIRSLHNQGKGAGEFDAIVSPLREADHPNLIKVIGHCFRWEGRFVVYECLKLDFLDLHLFDPEKEPLDCDTRMNIAIGCAKGLEYLHTTMDPPVVHRNLKAENVHLDEEFVPKLFDYGVPKKDQEWWNTSRPFGIVGWIAPEYLKTGLFTLESDVYSFGILLLVILTGRKAFDEKKLHDRSIAGWAKSVWDKDMKDKDLKDIKDEVFTGIIDPRMKGTCPKGIAFPYFKLALACIDLSPSSRPKMPNVCRQLVTIASLHSANTESHSANTQSHSANTESHSANTQSHSANTQSPQRSA